MPSVMAHLHTLKISGSAQVCCPGGMQGLLPCGAAAGEGKD